MKQKHLLLGLIFICFLSACSLIGLNLDHHTPKRAGKYPKFTEKDSLIGFLNPARSCYDVHYYDLAVDFDLNQKSISGVVKMYFEVSKDTDSLQVDLAEHMRLKSVTMDEVSLTFTRKFDAVFIHFKQTLHKGDFKTITMSYDGKPTHAIRPPWEGGFVWKKDKHKQPWVGVACEKVGAHHWWPMKDHNADEPDSCTLHYSVPKGLMAVANGRLINREIKEQKETFTWHVSYPINSYNITFYIGDFVEFSIPYNSALNQNMRFYVLKDNLEKAKEHFKQAKEVIGVYEDLFDTYPFWRDEYKLIESPFAGMEHQTAIAYGADYKNNYTQHDYIIVHETAHEWWGNSISVGDYADIWIHEGIATYTEALLFEKIFGYNQYLSYLSFYGITVANKKPMVGPRDVSYWNYKDGDPYVKGAMMLLNLRSTMDNDSLFFAIIKTFYKQHKYSIVQSSDFVKTVNTLSGKDYNWFFQQFLFDRRCPKLAYKLVVNKTTKESYLHYKWEDVRSDFVMPIYIQNIYAQNAAELILLHPTTTEQVIKIKDPQKFFFERQRFYYTYKKSK